MLSFIPKTLTFVATGARVKYVTCEKCQTEYAYELIRTGMGEGNAPFFLGQASAAARAKKRAHEQLEKRLASEAELVPCPTCGWVNEDLIKAYRASRYRWLVWALLPSALFLGLLAFSLLAALARMVGVPEWEARVVTAGLLAAYTALSLILILPLRGRLLGRIDPNRTYPQRPVVPPGTPPAFLCRKDLHTGEEDFERVPNRYAGLGPFAGWAVLRPGQTVLPDFCCVCMAPATTNFCLPFFWNDSSVIEVPLCASCAARIRRRLCLTSLAVVAVVAALSCLVALVFPEIGDKWIIVILAAVVAVAGVLLLPKHLCCPYKCRILDVDSGIVVFQASSRAFMDLLIEQVRESDGDVPR
jgi:hypothetical protein